MSILGTLAQYRTLREAAKYAAGNWQNWNHFWWMGEKEYPNSHNIMLGYLVGPQSTIREHADSVFVHQQMAKHKGMHDDPSKTADNYGADFHGDKNLLTGIMVRVYDDHKITPAFKLLYKLARKSGEEPLNQKVFEEVNRREMLTYLNGELPYQCEKLGKEYTTALCVSVLEALLEDGQDFDSIGDDEVVAALEDCLGIERVNHGD